MSGGICRWCLQSLKYMMLILFIPPFLNYTALQKEGTALMGDGKEIKLQQFPKCRQYHIMETQFIAEFPNVDGRPGLFQYLTVKFQCFYWNRVLVVKMSFFFFFQETVKTIDTKKGTEMACFKFLHRE